MIPRLAHNRLLHALHRSPAVVLLGARQVGKTTLARSLGNSLAKPVLYLDLERPSDLAKLEETELYLSTQKNTLLILDEVQRLPSLFPILRSMIDDRIATGETACQFLLLGSASLDVIQGASESLAGRVAYYELSPLNILETSEKQDTDTLWLRGGFPRSLLQLDDSESLSWRLDLIASYLARDIPALGPRIPAETLRRFWTMLAHTQGQPMNGPTLAGNLSLSVPTIHRYRDILSDLLLLRQLRPWSNNAGKRLVKTPKVYVRDSGLCHALLGIVKRDDLLAHPVIGASWEGFVIENLLSVAPRHVIPWFYRSHAGAEVDLILEISPNHRIAIEIKRTLTPKRTKGFTVACEDIQAKEKYFVYAGTEIYPLSPDTTVISLAAMMEKIQGM